MAMILRHFHQSNLSQPLSFLSRQPFILETIYAHYGDHRSVKKMLNTLVDRLLTHCFVLFFTFSLQDWCHFHRPLSSKSITVSVFLVWVPSFLSASSSFIITDFLCFFLLVQLLLQLLKALVSVGFVRNHTQTHAHKCWLPYDKKHYLK